MTGRWGADAIPAEKRAAWHKGLCKWCLQNVSPPRRTFCCDECVSEWKRRTNPAVARDLVERRDGGICSACGMDCMTLKRDLERAASARDVVAFTSRVTELGIERFVEQWSLWNACRTLIEKTGKCSGGHWYVHVRTLWEMDHDKALEEGGDNELSNLRTLCWKCHKAKTAEHAARRAARRRAAKEKA